MSPPHSSDIQILPFCESLKKTGHLLEREHREMMERLRVFFTKMCRDDGIDLVIRLKVLVCISEILNLSKSYIVILRRSSS